MEDGGQHVSHVEIQKGNNDMQIHAFSVIGYIDSDEEEQQLILMYPQ